MSEGNQGIISSDIISAEVRIGYHTISRSDYGILAVITAHNEIEYVKLNVRILLDEFKGTDSEVVVVDNYSDDGLGTWLAGQGNVSYIICDDKMEGYGEILKVIGEQFGEGRDLLLLRANCFLTPGSIAAMREALHSREDFAAVGPIGNALPGEQKCYPGNSYAEAQAFQKGLADETAETSYLDTDIMLLKSSTVGSLETGSAVPQAVVRGYMKNMRKRGKRFAVAKKAVCFAVGNAKDESYRTLAPVLYRQEKLHQLFYHFGDIVYKGVHLFKYLESDILAGINYRNRFQNIKRSKITCTWSTEDVLLSTEKEAEETREIICSLPKKEVLFVTMPIRRMHQGKYIHTAMETFMASLDEGLYLDLECVEDMAEDREKNIPTKNRYAVLESAIPRIFGIEEVDKEDLLDFVGMNFIHPLETFLDIKFNDDILRGCCLKAIYLLKIRKSFIEFYKETIARVEPKVIIYSHGQDMVLTCLRDAALELGVPTLEISHGIRTETAYHPQLAYADYLVAYSGIIAEKSREQGNDRVLGIGKPGVYVQADKPKEQYPLTVISFISSLENEIFDYARNLAMRLGKRKYLVIYKAHNSEMWGQEEIAKIQEETANLKFVAGSMDIRDLIGMSDIVVGIRSTGIFDALPYPKVKVVAVRDKAISFSEAGPNEILQEVAERGDIVMAEDEEQLYQEILNYKRGDMYRETEDGFWPKDAEERFRALVDSYLQKI